MEKTIETTITEATTTPPSPATNTTPNIAPGSSESSTTASSEISTRTSGNAKASPTTSRAACGIQGRPGIGLIIVILLAPMVIYEK